MSESESDKGTPWVEVSVAANKETAETLSAVLSRYGSVAVEEISATPTSGDSIPPIVTVRCYLTAEELQKQRPTIEQSIWHLSQLMPVGEPVFRELQERDWMEAWKQHYPVLHITDRLVVVPTWRRYCLKEREIPIAMDPGMAFGTGLHPSTQLCLRALEEVMSPDDKVLDVGTGTGILAIAAIKLGAGEVLALDVEEASVKAATKNAALNGVADRIRVELGSVVPATGRLGRQLPIFATGSYDLVLVNIIAEVIVGMAPALLGMVHPGSRIITGGIIKEREQLVMDAFSGWAKVIRREQEGDWVSLSFHLPDN